MRWGGAARCSSSRPVHSRFITAGSDKPTVVCAPSYCGKRLGFSSPSGTGTVLALTRASVLAKPGSGCDWKMRFQDALDHLDCHPHNGSDVDLHGDVLPLLIQRYTCRTRRSSFTLDNEMTQGLRRRK